MFSTSFSLFRFSTSAKWQKSLFSDRDISRFGRLDIKSKRPGTFKKKKKKAIDNNDLFILEPAFFGKARLMSRPIGLFSPNSVHHCYALSQNHNRNKKKLTPIMNSRKLIRSV